MSNPQEDRKNLKRKSTDGNYTAPPEDGGRGYVERRTLRRVPRGSMGRVDRKKIDNKQLPTLKRGLGAETSSKIINFLKRRGYKRDKSIKRETYKPDIKIIEENPELRNLNEQAKDKQSLIDFNRWVVKPKKSKKAGKRRRKKKRKTRKRRRTKKKRKRRRRKRRRTRK